MADRSISLTDLRRILSSFGCWEDKSRGKGSHTTFYRNVGDHVFSYQIPTTRRDVLICYLKGVRRKLHLTPDKNVTDEDFYSRM